MAGVVLPWSDPEHLDTYEPLPPGDDPWVLPWSNPRYVDTTQVGFRVTGLWSNPGFVSTVRLPAPFSFVNDDGDLVALVAESV